MDKARRDEQDAWERCEDVKRKMNKLSLTRKFYMRASQIRVRRNRAAIVAGKLKNRQLRRALNALREKERCALGLSDLARMQRRVSSLEKYHNEQLEVARAKTRTLAAASTDAEMAVIDLMDVLDKNTPPLRRQRALTSEVREALQKLEKVRALDRTCRQQLQPMLDERTIFDAQLETMGRTVTNKHQEFDQLMFMYHDATRSREAARGQLHQVDAQRKFSTWSEIPPTIHQASKLQ